MEQKFDEFSMKEAAKLADSDLGKSLFTVIQGNHKAELSKIQQYVSEGNMDAAKAAVLKLMEAKDTSAILRGAGGQNHG